MIYVGIIYRCYCTTSKKNYIGQTRTSLKERICSHRWKACHEPNNIYFYNAWNKYGEETLEWSILERVSSDSKEGLTNLLDEREKYWIAQYDSFNNGYNLTPGGLSGTGEANKIAVKVFKEDGEFLGIYDSIKEAASIYHVDNSGVTKCCKRLLQSAGKKDGYRLIWRYLDDTYTQEDMDKLDPLVFDAFFYESQEFAGTYTSVKDLQSDFNVSKSSVSSHLRGRLKSVRTKDGIRLCLKYKKWKYYEETGHSKYVQ